MKIKHLIFGERSLTKVAIFASKGVAGMSLVAMVFFGGLIGLLLGGLLTTRPHHVRAITTVRRAIRRGRWAVVIHPVTQRQLDRMVRSL